MEKEKIVNSIENKAVYCNYISVLAGEISDKLEDTEQAIFKLNITDKPINELIDKMRTFTFIIEELANKSWTDLMECFEDLNEMKDNANSL